MGHDRRVHIGRELPDAYRAMRAWAAEVEAGATAAGLDQRLVDLVKVRTSQLNGCAFCLEMHHREALDHGERPERLAVLPAWRETDLFTGEERSALVLAESVTLVADGHVPDTAYEEAAAGLSATRIAAVSWVVIVMNAWNRIATTSRYAVGPR
jgi:AhpD family alkylhydroperoxidase